MALSTEEQKRRTEINRKKEKALVDYFKKNNLMPRNMSEKAGRHIAFSKIIPCYNPSKKTIRAAGAYILEYGTLEGFQYKKSTKWQKSTGFYSSQKWRDLRLKAFVKYGRKCCVCGRSAKDGIVLHVDHIKPRSLRPDLALDIDNLQILCEDCNLGKSNHYSEDWR